MDKMLMAQGLVKTRWSAVERI